MPELPEVETVRRGLEAGLLGRTVIDATAYRTDQLRPDANAVLDGLPGRTFTAARRSGKHLFCDLDDGHTLASHLRMTGQWRIQDAGEPMKLHTHVVIALDDGHELRWRDVRRFGWIHLLPTDRIEALATLAATGPDVLTLSRDQFTARIGGCRRQMKALLLSQDKLAGIGNIYADEILWAARVHPQQVADRLSTRKLNQLYEAVQSILIAAIEARGSSIDGEYVAVDGDLGGYQLAHAAYGREGQPCQRCGKPIRKIIIASRSSCYCPNCQRRR